MRFATLSKQGAFGKKTGGNWGVGHNTQTMYVYVEVKRANYRYVSILEGFESISSGSMDFSLAASITMATIPIF